METSIGNLESAQKKEYIQNKIQANLDWVSTLTKKVDEGIITRKEADETIARAMTSREIRKELAENKARRDPLTELYNRRAFREEYEELIANGSHFALLIIDIDDFKNINDQFGLLAGDDILFQTALNLSTNLRQLRENDKENDFVGRWGGDEFVILLKNISTENELKAVADKLMKVISERAFSTKMTGETQDIPVSVSVGAGIYKGGDKNVFFDLVNKKALTEAKETGKNKLVIINK